MKKVIKVKKTIYFNDDYCLTNCKWNDDNYFCRLFEKPIILRPHWFYLSCPECLKVRRKK